MPIVEPHHRYVFLRPDCGTAVNGTDMAGDACCDCSIYEWPAQRAEDTSQQAEGLSRGPHQDKLRGLNDGPLSGKYDR
jgi:hypothetical protein